MCKVLHVHIISFDASANLFYNNGVCILNSL